MKETNPSQSTETLPQSESMDIRILKIRSCSSRTGLSTLTYHIGCDAEGQLYLRLYANSGNGFFNNCWIKLGDIETALSEQYFTSYALKPLYQHRSTNSPGFLLAALLEEKLVSVSLVQKRCYEKGDFDAFTEGMKSLVDSNTRLNQDDKPPKIIKKR